MWYTIYRIGGGDVSEHHTVLIVEDETLVALKQCEVLKKDGYRVEKADSGELALEIVSRGSIDLILMDINLGSGGMDGAETARRILHKYSIPIVFLTGYTERDHIQKVKGITGYGIVHKQAGDFVLCQAVEMALKLSESHRRIQEEVAERKRRETLFTDIVENIPSMVFMKEAEGLTFYLVNKAAEELMGMERGELIGKDDYEIFPGEEADFFRKKDLEALSSEHTVVIEEELLTTPRGPRYVSTKKVPLYDEEGKHQYLLGISEDITELKKALEEKNFLMKEIHHRVKNNLLMIGSLISLKESALGNSVDLSDLKSQIDAIRIVHEKLYTAKDLANIEMKEYIGELLHTIFSSLTNRSVRIVNELDRVYFDSKRAIPIGLIVNELATNAIKHGFSGEEEAVFSIQQLPEGEAGQLAFTVSNTGNAFPENVRLHDADTLGLQLITALINQLQGQITLVGTPRPVFTITLPIDG